MHFSNERMNGRPKKQMQAILYLAVYTLQSPFYTPPPLPLTIPSLKPRNQTLVIPVVPHKAVAEVSKIRNL